MAIDYRLSAALAVSVMPTAPTAESRKLKAEKLIPRYPVT
jgi:hypothetical protein